MSAAWIEEIMANPGSAPARVGIRWGAADFRATLEEFKRQVPFPVRAWDEEGKWWWVDAMPRTLGAVASIFPDFKRKIEAFFSAYLTQGNLFGPEPKADPSWAEAIRWARM